MKKKFYVFACATLFLFACGADEKSSDKEEQEALKEQIRLDDSLSKEIEELERSVEESGAELDSALKEIEEL